MAKRTNGHVKKKEKKVTKNKILIQILRELEGNKGYVKPKELVDYARDEDSPIHDMFEWNDSKAAELYRVQQARQIITRVQVELVGEDKTDAYYSAKVQIKNVPVRGYFSVDKVLSNDDLYDSVIQEAVREIRYWQKKFKHLKEMKGLVDETKLSRLEERFHLK